MDVAPDPPPIFLDTSYINALINTRDQWHPVAVEWERHLALSRRKLLTTEFILVEIADGLAAVRFRTQAVRVIETLQASSQVEIVPASSYLFSAALDLYCRHADKAWGLTDCASFAVMSEGSLSEALTADEHFRQAGFRALLLDRIPGGQRPNGNEPTVAARPAASLLAR